PVRCRPRQSPNRPCPAARRCPDCRRRRALRTPPRTRRRHRSTERGRAPALRRTLASGTRDLIPGHARSWLEKRCYRRGMTTGRVAALAAVVLVGVLAGFGCTKKPASKAEAGQIAAA